MAVVRFTYKLFFIYLFFPFPGLLQAQQTVTIEGNAVFAKNEEIRLLVFDDLLNLRPVVAATDHIDDRGNFKLSCPLRQISLAQLAIRNAKAELFIVPEHAYNFHIQMDTALFSLVDPEKYGGFLQITTDHIDTNDLNYKINRFSYFFERVLNKYAFALTVDRSRAAFDTLTQMLKSHFPIRYNPLNFYESYLYYSHGLLERLFYDKYPDTIYRRYFDNDYILYDNPAYMQLFNDCYSGYLYNSRYIPKDLLTQTINEHPDYLTLFNEAGRDPMLTNERLRELVIVKNLGEFYYDENFDRQNILKLLKYLKSYTHFPDHTIIIEHMLKKIENAVHHVCGLTMVDAEGKSVSVDQFDGKPVYVQVFQSDCADCVREMMLIREFQKIYGDSIQFVSLNLDADETRYRAFCEKYAARFDWPILYFNKNYDWMAVMGIETLPDYFILNAEGNILLREAPSPEHGLSEYLFSRYHKEKPEPENPMFRDRN